MKNSVLNYQKAIVVALIASAGVIFYSCNKSDDPVIPGTETGTTMNMDDELYTSDVYDEAIDIADEAVDLNQSSSSNLKSGGFRYNRLSDCVTVTREITAGVVTMTIDFGETNCLCNDGRERRGKIIMHHEGNYTDSIVNISFTFENFYVDDNQVTGSKTVTQTYNELGQRVSSISIEGALILANEAGTINYESEKTRTIVEGTETRMKRDDVIETTGYSILSMDTIEVKMTIIEPLVRKNEVDCFKYIVQGIRQIERTGQPTITINYGDGTCDNLADVTVDGVTTTIELKHKRRTN